MLAFMTQPTAEPSTKEASAKSRREDRRIRHQDLARNQFLDSAEEVFGRKGFHETTLKEIAELAEFSVGSVYSFFANKDDLFRQIFLRRGGQFMEEFDALLAEAGDDPEAQLRGLVDFQVGFYRRHKHFGRLFLRNSSAALLSDDRMIDRAMMDNFEAAMESQAAIFRLGQERGVFRSGDPQVLARLFSGIISAFQALDPEVISDSAEPGVGYPVDELHDVVRAAFAAK